MEFKSAKELLTLCKEHDMPISAVMRTRECTLGEADEAGVDARMARAWDIMRTSAHEPLTTPLRSMGGLIGGESRKLNEHCAKIFLNGVYSAPIVCNIKVRVGNKCHIAVTLIIIIGKNNVVKISLAILNACQFVTVKVNQIHCVIKLFIKETSVILIKQLALCSIKQ